MHGRMSALLLGFLTIASGLALAPAGTAHSPPPCVPEDCALITPTPRDPFWAGAVEVKQAHIDIDARDGLATTTLRLLMLNADGPMNTSAQVRLNIPLPAGGAIDAFNLSMDGQLLEGTVQERQVAQQTYTEAQQQGRAAALVEHASSNLVRLSVAIPSGKVATLQVRYIEWIPVVRGDMVYRIPLSQMALPDGLAILQMNVQEAGGFDNLRAKGGLQFDTAAGRDALGIYAAAGQAHLADLVAAWTPLEPSWRSTIVAAASGEGETGVPAVARLCLAPGKPIPRDVVFVLDRSGSMSGSKMTQAIDSLAHALGQVRPEDRFGIITFDDRVEPVREELVAGEPPRIAADQETVRGISARGSTNIEGSLLRALDMLAKAESSRMPQVIFVTDGLPTVGQTNLEKIIENVAAANGRKAPIYAVPIGLDADGVFLADLAADSGGVSLALSAGDALLGARMDRIYDLTSRMQVTDLEVSASNATLVGDAPTTAGGDLCLDLAMRVDLSTPSVVITVRGKDANGTFVETFAFPTATMRFDSGAAALFGRAAVQQLLRQERDAGKSEELRQQIIGLAIETRQLTPYTSWVLAEPVPAPVQPAVPPVPLVTVGGSVGPGRPVNPVTPMTPVTPASPATPVWATGSPGTPPNVDDGSSAQTATGTAQTPGFEVVILVAALLGGVVLLRRRM